MERNDRRLPIIHSRQEGGICPECGNRSLKHHKQEGEIVCEKCGYVLKDKTFGQIGKGTRKGSGGAYNKYP
jgi:ribosomal protein S27AE